MPLPFSQLWTEEEAFLAEVAKTKPACLVEIGTAQGGSAYIFATHSPASRIVSFDIAPCTEAYRNLEEFKNVQIVKMASTDGAAQWHALCGEKVDAIFIDGSHTLSNVFADYNSWLPHLKSGALVMFHDYDPIERGGVPHLGVRVFIDALLNTDALAEVRHVGRILAARVHRPKTVTVQECNTAWNGIREAAETFVNGSAAALNVKTADEKMIGLLNVLFSGTCPDGRPLLFERPVTDASLRSARKAGESILDDLTLGYLLEKGLKSSRDAILNMTADRKAFFKWEEWLEMLSHQDTLPSAGLLNIEDLSKRIAHELLRLNFLGSMRVAITGR